jgi:hypothetical protein
MAGDHILYIPTYSGSNSMLYAVDTDDCKILWGSRKFTGMPHLRGQQWTFEDIPPVMVGHDCLPTERVEYP